METNDMVPAPRFFRTDFDGASEVLTLVRVTDGPWYGVTLVQITTGSEIGDDFVGLYELDGERVDSHDAGAEWEALTAVPQHVVDTIESDWETGSRIITRLGLEASKQP